MSVTDPPEEATAVRHEIEVLLASAKQQVFLTTELSPTTNSFLEEAKYTFVHY